MSRPEPPSAQRAPQVPRRDERAHPLAAALQLLLPLVLMAALLAAAGGALWSGARWLLATEDGARWLLGVLPGVQVQGLRGTLLGPRLEADLLQVHWGRTGEQVRIEGLALQGIEWHRPAEPGLWLELALERATARRVVLDTGAAAARPLPQPASLAAPLRARVAAAALDELRIDALAPLAALSASGVTFDGRKGARHVVEQAAAQGWGLAMRAGGSIGNAAPLPVQLEGRVEPVLPAGAHAPWTATLHAQGPLARIALAATLRGRPGGTTKRGAAPPAPAQLDAEAELRLLEARPLQRVRARTEALDLAALFAGAPVTRLAGDIDLAAPAPDQPITATLHLENRLPGRWNERRLPLARLALELRGELARPTRLEAPQFALELADARGSAGRLSGRLVWDRHELQLDARLDGIEPQRLDGRAAAMALSGPLALQLHGLPSPDPQDQARPPPWRADARLALDGRIEGAPTAVRLEAEGSASAGRFELARLHAKAGSASADLAATLARAASDDWSLSSRGSVDDFDPLPWWPGAAGGAWRQGPHRIDADWQLELRAPGDARRMAPLALLQSLAGSGRVRVHDSVLAGVALAADVTLANAAAGAGGAATSTLQARIDAAGNLLAIDGRADASGSGQNDRWQVSVQADQLAALAPLARLDPALAEWLPRQGSAKVKIAAEGRWPNMASDGDAHIERLQAGTLALARGDLQWRLQVGRGAGDAAPLALGARLSGLQLGGQRADQLRAELRGTLAAHRIELLGTLPLVPPAALAQLLGAGAARGTRALLEAQGSWQGSPGGGGHWRAQVDRVAVGPWDGSSAPDAPLTGALWADARTLRAELDVGRDGALTTLQAEPGRLQLAAGALALRWDAVQADLRGARAAFELRADIEPFALAPLLARAQPAMGWAGDLRLAARVAVKAGERFDADLAFERRDGDLHIDSGEGAQLLGLSEFRLALSAHDGVWDFSPVFSGRSLGDIRGSLRARTTPQARWPQADAALEGRIQARVADIGIWTSWVPPGWRLVGEMHTTASVGGRFGAPTYTGELAGSGLGVRNLLQGVNVSDGELQVRLDGDSARIERFSFKGGDGRVQIGGGASFGTSPSARLELEAERFRVLGRVDRQLSLSGRAALALGTESGRLDGSLRVDDGLFDFGSADAPTLDDDVSVHEARPAQAGPAAPQPPRPRYAFALALDVDLGEQVRARGRGVETGLRGKLRITNPGGRLAVNGSIHTDHGTYAAYGQKLEIERGTIAFAGVPDNPRLDILAIRPNLDTRVGVLISGSAQAPRVRLYAEPDMSESDKLSWLLLGRASEGLGRNDTAIIQRAAVALLAGEGEAPTDSLLRRLGLDDLSVRQSDTDVHATVISLGKQLSRRWYVGYERSVNATTGTWQLVYRIAQRLTVRAQSGFENSLDIMWTWRLQEPRAVPGERKSVPARTP